MTQQIRSDLGHVGAAAQCQMLLFVAQFLVKSSTSKKVVDPEVLRVHVAILFRAAIDLAPLEALAPGSPRGSLVALMTRRTPDLAGASLLGGVQSTGPFCTALFCV